MRNMQERWSDRQAKRKKIKAGLVMATELMLNGRDCYNCGYRNLVTADFKSYWCGQCGAPRNSPSD